MVRIQPVTLRRFQNSIATPNRNGINEMPKAFPP